MTGTYTVTVTDDALVEAVEDVDARLSISDAFTGTQAFVGASDATATITDNDTPTFTLSGDLIVAEGGVATYTITTDLAIAAGPTVVINIDTADGTAINPADFGDLQNATYNAATGELTLSGPFAAGATVATLTVATVNDTLQEGNEDFDVNITAATVDGNAATVAGSVTTVITDNDTAVFTLTGDANVAEGGVANYTVTLTGADIAAGQTVVINIDTADGTAINPADFGDLQNVSYNAATGQLTVSGPFSINDTFSFTVNTVDDSIQEGAESFDRPRWMATPRPSRAA